MIKRTSIAAALAGAIAAGCATQPDKIPTQRVSPVAYKDFTCEQVVAEMQQTSAKAGELRGRLKKLADDDEGQMAVGMILFWPALFFLEGKDSPEAFEYSRIKGEHEALFSVAVQKNCTIPASIRPTRWIAQADATAREACPATKGVKFLAADDKTETYQFACADAAHIVLCDSGACRSAQ